MFLVLDILYIMKCCYCNTAQVITFFISSLFNLREGDLTVKTTCQLIMDLYGYIIRTSHLYEQNCAVKLRQMHSKKTEEKK